MKKKHIELLNHLLDSNQILTSMDIANAIGISQRSVKNYVIEINLLSNERVILSSKQGYLINRQAARELLHHQDEQLPQTWEERASYIIKQLMLEHVSSLDLYSLCEELCIEYSTLKSDISRMNKAYQTFNIQFVCEHDFIRILGDEKHVRRLISYLIQEETSNQIMDINALKDSFRTIDIQKVSDIIQNTFHHYHYYINDFSNINLLIHFTIIIDRLKDGNRVQRAGNEFQIESAHEASLVNDLCIQLETQFDISLDKAERFEIYMLFKTNANYSMPNSQDALRKVVGDEIIKQTKTIVSKINEDYYINLETENFLTPFALHIKNLLLRVQNGRFTKNPLAESIKNSCPIVYDIAISVSIELMRYYHFHINEDEVSFLALHIGAEIERQKSNDTKIQCVLICPAYMQMTSALYNQLLINFGNQINIIKTVSYEFELKDLEFDLILTTIKLNLQYQQPVYTIPPFSGQLNALNFLQVLDDYRISKKNYILKKNFHYFFSDHLFVVNPPETTRDDIIHLLANRMKELGYVEDTFEKNVHIREKAGSTAFVNIAIPHSMEMEALKTCIGVVISKAGIQWEHHVVHLVLLVAINKTDKQTFHELYEALVMLFSDERVMNLVKNCTSLNEFEDMTYSFITYE